MNLPSASLERQLASATGSGEIAWACTWLQACGYPGLGLLAEALDGGDRDAPLVRDALGIDLNNVSCVFIGRRLVEDVKRNGRVFLRNVRHGLYILPFAVEANLGIGCPVDPAFALGGERHKNPYGEKLALAGVNGIEVDEGLWHHVLAVAAKGR